MFMRIWRGFFEDLDLWKKTGRERTGWLTGVNPYDSSPRKDRDLPDQVLSGLCIAFPGQQLPFLSFVFQLRHAKYLPFRVCQGFDPLFFAYNKMWSMEQRWT